MSALNTLLQPDNWFVPSELQPILETLIETPEPIVRPSADREEFEQTPLLSSESLLIRRAIAGDEGAFEELISRHMPKLRQIAYNLLNNREDAEEAVQDALLSAYRHLDTFRGQSLFSTWLTRVVINAARMLRRRNAGRPEVSLDEILDADPPHKVRAAVDPGHDPERACEVSEIRSLIDEGLRGLSPQLREAFRLRDIEGLPTEVCLAIVGIQLSAFKSRVARARHRLANSLRPVLFSTPVRHRRHLHHTARMNRRNEGVGARNNG